VSHIRCDKMINPNHQFLSVPNKFAKSKTRKVETISYFRQVILFTCLFWSIYIFIFYVGENLRELFYASNTLLFMKSVFESMFFWRGFYWIQIFPKINPCKQRGSETAAGHLDRCHSPYYSRRSYVYQYLIGKLVRNNRVASEHTKSREESSYKNLQNYVETQDGGLLAKKSNTTARNCKRPNNVST
jgi:hypothetical protein